MTRQFLILGYSGWKNTGDDAMAYALLQKLHNLYPTVSFVIPSQIPISIPPDMKNLVKFIPTSPLLFFREIIHSSILIYGGGTFMFDHINKINRFVRLCETVIVLAFAKLFCKRIYLISIGVEPLSTTWGKFLSKQICKLADFISVRDKSSHEILNGLGLGNKVTVSFDLTALLQPLSRGDKSLVKKADTKILGVSILPFFEIYYSDKEKDLLFVHEIAKVLNQWLKRECQSLICLFVFKGKSKIDDVRIVETLQKQLNPAEHVKLIPYNPDPIETLSKVAQCHAFVGMRYHSCLFAYLTNTPLLIINYFQKCQALAEDVGLSKHAVISIEEILNGQFGTYHKNLQEHPGDFVAALPINIAKQRAKKGLPMDKNLEGLW